MIRASYVSVLCIMCAFFMLSACSSTGGSGSDTAGEDVIAVDSNTTNGDITNGDQIAVDGNTADGDIVNGDEEMDADSSEVFDPQHPGLTVQLIISSLSMMGQTTNLANITVHPTAREDVVPGGKQEIPLDTCRLASSGIVSGTKCKTYANCGPEQICDTKNGNVCSTPPAKLLNVGPISVSGFFAGKQEFLYNAAQKGVYTENGAGDGRIPGVDFNTTYAISGKGDSSQGLASFSGSLKVPSAFKVLKPVIAPDPQMHFPVVNIDPSKDLQITWDSSKDPNVAITLIMSGPKDSVTCRMKNDGEFTLNKTNIQALGLSTGQTMMDLMKNKLEIKMNVKSPIKGNGITFGEMWFLQSYAGVLVKVSAK